jgi:hypothetical protein
VGAHAASASVVEFVTVNDQTHIHGTARYRTRLLRRSFKLNVDRRSLVLGTASELDVGGFSWDVRLAAHLAQAFAGQHNSSPVSPRATFKLLKEAQKVRTDALSLSSFYFSFFSCFLVWEYIKKYQINK